MRLLLLNQYFWPDRAATAQLLTDLGEDLAARGWEVTALAGRGSYVAGREGRLPARETFRGVAIRRVWCTSFGRRTTLGRLADYLSFLLAAATVVLLGPRHDVVVGLSTPPLVAVLGALGRRRGTRFVYKVEDLYPEVAVALGTLRPGSLANRFLARVSRAVLARTDAVVALDEAMASLLRQRGARRVEVIPNWADGEAIAPDPEAGRRFRREVGIGEEFVVLYAGNLGLAHRFDAVVGAARLLAERTPGVRFLFVGGGPRLEDVRRATEDLPNVTFLPYQPRERLRALYAAADVHLITLRDEVAGLLVPSKYAAALAAGKPVLLVGGDGSDLRGEISEHRLGWTCPHDAQAVARSIEQARAEPAIRRQAAAGIRGIFEMKYSRSMATSRWSRLLESIVHG